MAVDLRGERASAGTDLIDLPGELGGSGVSFPTEPFFVRHRLAGDARLTTDVLAELVAAVPCSWVRAQVAQRSPHDPREGEPLPLDTDLAALVRGLSTAGVSIRAYHLENTAAFREIADSLRPRLREAIDEPEGAFAGIDLGLFMASAGAVTPAHPDLHHNVLLHLVGRKRLWIARVGDPHRRHLMSVDYLRDPNGGMAELPPADSVVLEPGDGVYIPPYTFHWTEVDESAISLSVGFSTAATCRNAEVHQLDLRLRRFGLRPRPLGPDRLLGRPGRARAALGCRAVARLARRNPPDCLD